MGDDTGQVDAAAWRDDGADTPARQFDLALLGVLTLSGLAALTLQMRALLEGVSPIWAGARLAGLPLTATIVFAILFAVALGVARRIGRIWALLCTLPFLVMATLPLLSPGTGAAGRLVITLPPTLYEAGAEGARVALDRPAGELCALTSVRGPAGGPFEGRLERDDDGWHLVARAPGAGTPPPAFGVACLGWRDD